MAIFNKHIYLIILVLYPFFSQGKDQNFYADSIRARDLNRNATLLYQNGLHTQALDTFFLSLELRKKLYGFQNFNLAPVYMGIGVTYKSLGQSDLALQNYKLAEINYALAENYPYAQMAKLFLNQKPSKMSHKSKTKIYRQYYKGSVGLSGTNIIVCIIKEFGGYTIYIRRPLGKRGLML